MTTITTRINEYTMRSKRHACARCGRYGTADRMVFSRFTRRRFCADLNACEKRARRRDTLEAR